MSFMNNNAYAIHQSTHTLCEQTAARSTSTLLFSHCTAIRYWGQAIPKSCDLRTDRLHTTVNHPHQRRVIKHSIPHVWKYLFETVEIGDFLVTSPAMTWAQMAGHCSDEDLAVLGSSLMRRDIEQKTTDRSSIIRFVSNCGNFPHKNQCLRVLPMMAENTDSPPEARLHWLLVSQGIAQPEPNLRVQSETGQYWFIDLAVPNAKIAIEYQGNYHRSYEQLCRDATKMNELQRMGWLVIQVTWQDMLTTDSINDMLAYIAQMIERQRQLFAVCTNQAYRSAVHETGFPQSH